MMEMDIRQQRIAILTKLANDTKTFTHKLIASYPQYFFLQHRNHMARIDALSARSPHLLDQLQETERWLDRSYSNIPINYYDFYWKGAHRDLLNRFCDAIVFFSVNGIEG